MYFWINCRSNPLDSIQTLPVILIMFFVTKGSNPESHIEFSCHVLVSFSLGTVPVFFTCHDCGTFEDYRLFCRMIPRFGFIWCCFLMIKFGSYISVRNTTEVIYPSQYIISGVHDVDMSHFTTDINSDYLLKASPSFCTVKLLFFPLYW